MRLALAGLTLMVALGTGGATAEAHDRRGYLYAPYPPSARYVPPPRVYYPPPYYAAPPPVYVVPRPVPYGHYGHYAPQWRPHHHHPHRRHGGVFFSFRY
jgi:hypothetical protein